ncbi:MAG: MerR family transcriptional regulator, light-induced transcriptional regulator [Gaiellaceae bacterium]|nr:MerR family transcriptional regulator, light-induced transcriptional regulator [Gaiellaceae bacterium]
MRTLKTSEAATRLNVSPNTLRAWERRFGFPRPSRSPGKQRLYSQAEITALSDALADGLSVSSAVSVARDNHGADVRTLVSALVSFRSEAADEAMESSLAVRSVERSIEQMLLPALDCVHRRQGTTSAGWAFAVAWSQDWLARGRRLASRLTPSGGVLIGDATAPPLDPTGPYLLAFELCCVRVGLDVLSLPIEAADHLRDAVLEVQPSAVVIAGSRSPDHEVAKWAYQVRASVGRLPIALYHRRVRPAAGRGGALLLPESPVEALAELANLLQDAEDDMDANPARRNRSDFVQVAG